MGKANVDPAELRRFASDLAKFNNELHGLLQGLKGRMHNLEGTWRDQEGRLIWGVNDLDEAWSKVTDPARSFASGKSGHAQPRFHY